MEKAIRGTSAIEIVENKIQECEKLSHIESFRHRIYVLKDVLKELKAYGKI